MSDMVGNEWNQIALSGFIVYTQLSNAVELFGVYVLYHLHLFENVYYVERLLYKVFVVCK